MGRLDKEPWARQNPRSQKKKPAAVEVGPLRSLRVGVGMGERLGGPGGRERPTHLGEKPLSRHAQKET